MSKAHAEALVRDLGELFPTVKAHVCEEPPNWAVLITHHEKHLLVRIEHATYSLEHAIYSLMALNPNQDHPYLVFKEQGHDTRLLLTRVGGLLKAPQQYVVRDDRPRYIVIDPRATDSECGHNLSEEEAYENLGRWLIHHRNQRKGIYPNFDIEVELDREVRLQKRLGRWLMWLGKRQVQKT